MYQRFRKRDYPDTLTDTEARSKLGSDRFLAPETSYPEVFVRVAGGLQFGQFANLVTVTADADGLDLHFLTADKQDQAPPTGVTSIAVDEDVATWLIEALREGVAEHRSRKAEAEAEESGDDDEPETDDDED